MSPASVLRCIAWAVFNAGLVTYVSDNAIVDVTDGDIFSVAIISTKCEHQSLKKLLRLGIKKETRSLEYKFSHVWL